MTSEPKGNVIVRSPTQLYEKWTGTTVRKEERWLVGTVFGIGVMWGGSIACINVVSGVEVALDLLDEGNLSGCGFGLVLAGFGIVKGALYGITWPITIPWFLCKLSEDRSRTLGRTCRPMGHMFYK